MPYYVRPSVEGLVAHFKAVAAESPVPVIVYNIPARTGRDLGAAGLLELAAVPNIAGVKQAVATLDADTLELLAKAPEGFSVLGGEDTLLFPLMCMGAAGTISAAAHLCTDRFVAMIECGLAGKIEDGRAQRAARSCRDVVRDDRYRACLGNGAEMRDDRRLTRAHVVRHDHQRRDDRGESGEGRRGPDRVPGVVGSGSDDHATAPGRTDA